MTSSNSPQTVVIVGGGCAGILTRNTLAAKIGLTSSIKIVLITPRPYHNHLPGTLRMLVSNEGHLEERNFMYFPDEFNAGNKEVIIAKVVSIVDEGNNRHVVLDNGETVAYTVLLFTPGSVWEGPVAFPLGTVMGITGNNRYPNRNYPRFGYGTVRYSSVRV